MQSVSASQPASQTDRQEGRKEGRKVQRMRNMLAILALFVCTSICLGVEKEIPVPTNGWNVGHDLYNCAVNVDAVFVEERGSLRNNNWIAPVGCILNITTVESQNARIGAYACGARMSSNDRNFKDRSGHPKIHGPMTGNGINVCTGWFKNSTISGAYSVDISAAVDNNKATITGKKSGIIGWVYGGRTFATSASSNTVTISDVDIGNNNIGKDINENKGRGVVYGGYVHNDGVASNNEVNIDKTVRNVLVKGTVYGGYVGGNGTVTINKVNLTDVKVTNNVHGAWIRNGLASSNTVTITSGTVGSVFGGYIDQIGTVSSNTVTITTGTTVTLDVYGGRVNKGDAIDNRVTIKDGKIEGGVYGGYIANDGTATLNKVNLTNVTVSSNVYGAWIGRDGLASSNTVTINGGIVEQSVYGGYICRKGTATLNTVHLTSVTVNSDVYGARIGRGGDEDNEATGDGLVSSNTVTIKGGKIEGDVCGGCTNTGIVSSNTVTISSSVEIGGDVYGGWIDEDGYASSNTVTITTGTTITGDVFGGWVNDGDAIDNRVTLISGTVRESIYGGCVSNNGNAMNNTVTINGGEIEEDVCGGYTSTGIVSSNTVTISSSVEIGCNVYGARIGKYNEATGDGLVSSNTVTINGGIIGVGEEFDRGKVYGGYIEETGTATLNTVKLTDVDVTQDVYGAWIGAGTTKAERDREFEINEGVERAAFETAEEEEEEEEDRAKAERAAEFERDKVELIAAFERDKVEHAAIIVAIYGGIDEYDRIENPAAYFNGVQAGRAREFARAKAERAAEFDRDKARRVAAFKRSETKRARTYVLVSSNTVTITGGRVRRNVFGGYIYEKGTATLNEVNLTSVTVSGDVYGARIGDGLASSNTITINGGKIEGYVYGGYASSGTVSSNTVTINTGTTITLDVVGGWVNNGDAINNRVTLISGTVRESIYGGYVYDSGNAMYNTVTIKGGNIEGEVNGGCIIEKGTATGNEVHLTSVTVSSDVFGAWIGGNGLARDNRVTLISGTVRESIYGGYVYDSGNAMYNTVTINGGKIGGNVYGGFVNGNGKAIYNTITITGTEQSSPEFSTATILCGGVCANTATANASTNDAFTGNTLNIVETKGVVVNGISNFENYNFHLKDIKPGEVILTATSGGCSLLDVDKLDVDKLVYTPACTVDLSSSNIHLRTQSVLNEGECCTLIKSPQGFKDNIACKQFSFDNGGLVEYYWEIEIADNEQDLIAMLNRKELREEKAKPLLEGNVTGMVCINNGMDCIISKMEETESVLVEGAKLQRKGEIGAFYGLLANKSSYDDTGSHIDMTGMSMMGGIGIGWKGLVTGAFGEYGTGNSDIDSGPCPCEKKSEGKSNYVGGGLLGRYNVCEDEFRGTKLYLEAILRAGEVSNTFNIKEAKDGAEKECKYNDETTTYGGCALGGGYKHKVGEKIDVDWSLRYMFGYQDGKDVEKPVDVYGNRVKLESVKSSRIRVGVRGKYVELEKVKPYIGIWYEHELSGKVKGAIQNGVDNVGDIPATSFEGGTGIGELGISGKVGKLDVGISGQGYLGVRKGFGGMLKLKYAFGKGAHAKPPKTTAKRLEKKKQSNLKGSLTQRMHMLNRV